MGNGMNRVTTPKTGVTHGDATTPKNRCVTTTTPKGGWGGGEAASPVAREVTQLADRVQRLTICRRDPERFFEERSEIAHDLRKLARAVEIG